MTASKQTAAAHGFGAFPVTANGGPVPLEGTGNATDLQ